MVLTSHEDNNAHCCCRWHSCHSPTWYGLTLSLFLPMLAHLQYYNCGIYCSRYMGRHSEDQSYSLHACFCSLLLSIAHLPTFSSPPLTTIFLHSVSIWSTMAKTQDEHSHGCIPLICSSLSSHRWCHLPQSLPSSSLRPIRIFLVLKVP